MLVQNLMGESSALPTDPQHTPTILQSSSSQPQKTQKPRKPKRKNTHVPQPSVSTKNVADEAVYKEWGDRLVRAATTAFSLKAEQDSGNIDKTQSKATSNEASSSGNTSGVGPRCQDTMRDTIAQTMFENVSKLSNDSLLVKEVFVEKEVIDKEVNDEVQKVVKKVVEDTSTAKLIVNVAHVSDAALVEIKTSKPKAKRIVLQEPSESTTTTKIISSKQSQDKGKGIMVEELVKLKKKDQIRLDEEAALRTELVQGQDKEKRAGKELTQESAKKQKVDDDKETTELKQLMKIIPDEEEVAIDAIPLAVKSPK
nr:hypothetical protein [Tanacetum cinerariifolium]